MKSLFLRIFPFWAAEALFLILAILVTIALNPSRRGIEAQEPEILAEAVNAYQSGGEHGAHDYLEELVAAGTRAGVCVRSFRKRTDWASAYSAVD